MARKRIHSTKSSIEATGIHRRLIEANIRAMVIDKMDSAYGSAIGDIEIFVEEEDLDKAKGVLESYFQD
jgi:hypothetical protein